MGVHELDLGGAVVFAVPMRVRFRGITVREGVLVEGPAGWGEFCPFPEYPDDVAAGWLSTAVEAATEGWPEPVRETVPLNATVPAVGPGEAHEIVRASGCGTAKVKVADHPASHAEDLARVEAVRDALGPRGRLRVDANARWDVETAVARLRDLDRAAGGLDYAEQPCATIEELAAVRRRTDVRIAADESIRQADDPLRVAVAGAADVAVIKCTPLGGVRRSLRVAEAAGLPVVVSSALETGVGLAAQLALAGALPSLDGACGLGTQALLTADTATTPGPEHGELPVPRRPPHPDRLDEVRLTGDRERWWRDRLARAAALLAAAR